MVWRVSRDVSQWLPDELIDAALQPGRLKRGTRQPPVAFVDSRGGRHDASVLGIAHAELDSQGAQRLPNLFLDHLHCVPAPHEPAAVVGLFVAALKDYRLHKVVGDRYAAEWCANAFAKAGIQYEAAELQNTWDL